MHLNFFRFANTVYKNLWLNNDRRASGQCEQKLDIPGEKKHNIKSWEK